MPTEEYWKHRKIVETWRQRYGNWCPGYRRRGHAASLANPLTVDHKVPRSKGGSDHPSNLTVLCRHCNSRKRNKDPLPVPGGPQYRHPLN